jgi:hypothetical protein
MNRLKRSRHYRGHFCAHVLAASLSESQEPDGGMLPGHLGRQQPDQSATMWSRCTARRTLRR